MHTTFPMETPQELREYVASLNDHQADAQEVVSTVMEFLLDRNLTLRKLCRDKVINYVVRKGCSSIVHQLRHEDSRSNGNGEWKRAENANTTTTKPQVGRDVMSKVCGEYTKSIFITFKIGKKFLGDCNRKDLERGMIACRKAARGNQRREAFIHAVWERTPKDKLVRESLTLEETTRLHKKTFHGG